MSEDAAGPVRSIAVEAAEVVRVFATEDGESHLETLRLSQPSQALPVAGALVADRRPGVVDWHRVRQPQFAINVVGELEVEVSDGGRRRIRPGDLVFLEDVEGRGHVTRLLGPTTILFLRVAPPFDVTAWANGG
jgi:quercetin dioxygenase-like cupin family protein